MGLSVPPVIPVLPPVIPTHPDLLAAKMAGQQIIKAVEGVGDGLETLTKFFDSVRMLKETFDPPARRGDPSNAQIDSNLY